ncbi:MAG TPA: drug/metabolite exporter YedA [Kofleriaceae bacterium]|jgi:drug/metabolite transporter (DMT)-like permease
MPLLASLAAVYLIWSSTYLAMRVAVAELPPFAMASTRFLVAGAVLLAIARRRGAAWPSAAVWRRNLPIGVLLFVGGNGFVAVAEQSVPSGGAAIVCATMPLWVGVFGAVFGARPTARECASLVLGFTGVVVLMGGPSLAGKPAHVALLIMSPIAWAIGSLLSRRGKGAEGPQATMVNAGVQMLCGCAVLAIAAMIHREPIAVHASARAWLALGYLAVFGSIVSFTAYSWLLANARPVVATSYAFVNPVLAVLLGAALYGEPLGVTTVIANAMIVGAIVIAIKRPQPQRSARYGVSDT